MGDYVWLLVLPMVVALALYIQRKRKPPTADEIDRWEDEQW